jgi:hypothetical protein
LASVHHGAQNLPNARLLLPSGDSLALAARHRQRHDQDVKMMILFGSETLRWYLGYCSGVGRHGIGLISGSDPRAHSPKASRLSLQSNHLLAKAVGEGDTRMRLDTLPAKESRSGDMRKIHYHAKTGRSETQAKLPLELVPTTSNGNAFTLLLNQKALDGVDIVVYGPQNGKNVCARIKKVKLV